MMHSSLKSNLFTADEVCIQLLPFMIMPFMIFALSSCILLVLLIFPTLYHWGYSTNTDKKYPWHSDGGAGLSKDGTLLTKSNFYISHLRKLECPPDSIIWSTINTQPDHRSRTVEVVLVALGISAQNSMQRTQPWSYIMQKIFLPIISTNNIQASFWSGSMRKRSLSQTKKPRPDKDENDLCSRWALWTQWFFHTCRVAPWETVLLSCWEW